MNYFMMHHIMSRNKNKNKHHYSGGADLSTIIIPVVFFGSICMLGGIVDGIANREKEKAKPSYGYEPSSDDVKTFQPGEHIISVLIESPLDEPQQYEYHPGYKPIGIASATYGKSSEIDSGSCMLYVNDTEVIAKADGKVGEDLYFGDFGTPIDFENIEQYQDTYTVDFAKGTHIISVPVIDPTDYNVQYDFHEGYEPIGIATAAHGKSTDISSGACILYINTEDVTCKKEENNEYTEFGTVKEETKIKVKR